jgi:uncharacterized OB-fold protein
MNGEETFTIESFYKFVAERKIMAARCTRCGRLHLPPRPLCDNCYSTSFEWIELSRKGKLVAFTVIHIAPSQFQHMVPYAVGIVQLQNGLRLPGIISGVSTDKLRIGLEVTFDFQACNGKETWPKWPRYCFKPA